jgi:hypothetical protein
MATLYVWIDTGSFSHLVPAYWHKALIDQKAMVDKRLRELWTLSRADTPCPSLGVEELYGSEGKSAVVIDAEMTFTEPLGATHERRCIDLAVMTLRKILSTGNKGRDDDLVYTSGWHRRR